MKIILSIILLVFSIQLFSQNYLIPEDTSTFHGAVQLSTSNFENIIALLPGYTVKGRLTFGVDLGKGKDKLNRLNSTIIRPNINYLFVKQEEGQSPASVNIEAGYQYNILQATSFDARAVQFGGTIYHELGLGQEFKLIPHVGILANRTTIKNNSVQQESATIIYTIGITMQWTHVYFQPKFIKNDGLTALSLNVGYIL